VDVFPENWDALCLFLESQTQWRYGARSPLGLDYQGVEVLLRLRSVGKARRAEMFQQLQVMEFAALEEFRASAE